MICISEVIDVSPGNLDSSLWSSYLAFHMMYSACKLNKRVTIYSLVVLLSHFWTSQLVHLWFWLLILDPHTGFSGDRSGGLVLPSLYEFSTVYCDPHKDFSIVKEAEIHVFLEFPCFFYDQMDVGNFISGSSAFSKSSLYIWKILVHVLLKPSLKDFEHYFVSMWNEHNSMVVWTFFDIVLLWDWNENWPFLVQWSLLSFPNLLTYI